MKKLRAAIVFVLLMSIMGITAFADTQMPYFNYNYSESGNKVIYAPQAYVAEKIVYGNDLGIGAFSECNDFETDSENNMYILDSGNNRIVVLKPDGTLKKVIKINLKDSDGEKIDISGSQGIFVNDECIYICDTDDSRIIMLDVKKETYVRTVVAPVAKALGNDFIFKPKRVAVDSGGNLYIVSDGTYEGVINMTPEGDFLGFFASNEVSTSSWDLFWRRFSTVEQRKKMLQLIPQDFSSIDMDKQGFFLVTTFTKYNNSMVKRVNPGGNDVIRNLSNVSIVGDPSKYYVGNMQGYSSFSDVASGNNRIYACLDATRGKVFCYNNDGYLLYNFGTLSNQLGGFTRAVGLSYLNDDKIAVLDAGSLSLTIFAPTDYAREVNKGIEYQENLEYDKAIEQWATVLSYNENFELARNMIGTSYYNDGDYKTAKEYFKSTGNKTMYSAAKKGQRDEWIYNNINWIVTLVLVLIILVAVKNIFVFIRKRKKGEGKK